MTPNPFGINKTTIPRVSEEQFIRTFVEKLQTLSEEMVKYGEEGGIKPERVRKLLKKIYKILP